MDKRTNSQQKLHLRQSERGLSLTAQLLDYDGTPYNLTGLSVRFKDAKAGGKSVSDDNVTIAKDPTTGVVTYPVHSQVFAADGIGWFELYNTGGTLVDSTQNIVIKVEQDISGTIDNSDYISGLDGIKAQLQGIVNSAQQTLDNATSGANIAAAAANAAAQAAQTLANDIPTDPKYKGTPGKDGTDGKDGLSITISDTTVTAGDMTTEPDGTLVIDSNDSLYQAETGKWVLRGNIKGSKGDTGTGIQLKGSADSVDKLPATGNTAGDTYLVAGHLYIWEKDAWTDGGELQGPKGDDGKTSYFHIAYADSSDGTVGFTTVYPNLNLLTGTSINKQGIVVAGKNDIDNYDQQKIDVNPNNQYVYSTNIVSSTAYPLVVRNYILWFDKDGKYISISIGEDEPVNIPNSVISNVFTPPQNASSAQICPVALGQTRDSDTSIVWNHEKFEIGTTATPWMPSASEVTTADWPSYIGQYTDFTQADSTNPADYNWALFKGADGAPGIKGDTGDTGDTGATGPAGESAYQVWLDAGNTGTESDYLASLKGATGPAGKDGTTPDLTPYLKSADAAATYQTPTQVQARVDAKIVSVPDETTATSNSTTNTTVLYLVPEAS